jgi:hypothetical protein
VNPASCSKLEARARQSARSGIEAGIRKTTLRDSPSIWTTRPPVGRDVDETFLAHRREKCQIMSMTL